MATGADSSPVVPPALGAPAPRPRRGRIVAVGVTLVAALAVAGVLLSSPAAAPLAGSSPPAGAPSDLALVPVSASPAASLPPIASSPAATAVTPSAQPSPSASSASPSAGTAGTRATRIRIARLDIDLPVVEGDGIDAPMGKAAHFPSSAWPGAGSNVYLYGHAQKGMFLNLWDARVGDAIELYLVDRTWRTYTVTRILPKVPATAFEYVRPTKSEQLTLQTCTSYEPYAPRFLVIAVPSP